eukprot:3951756-Amphidinium_carterae.2
MKRPESTCHHAIAQKNRQRKHRSDSSMLMSFSHMNSSAHTHAHTADRVESYSYATPAKPLRLQDASLKHNSTSWRVQVDNSSESNSEAFSSSANTPTSRF